MKSDLRRLQGYQPEANLAYNVSDGEKLHKGLKHKEHLHFTQYLFIFVSFNDFCGL